MGAVAAWILVMAGLAAGPRSAVEDLAARPRARDLGLVVGTFPPGPWNAITDVEGVRVGHVTLIERESVRTGITAVLPHAGNLYLDPVPAAIHVGNGFGKLIGSTQVEALGELETPILLTCTLCVWKAADALAAWMLDLPGMAGVRSLNPLVGETNDGFLNDIRLRPLRPEHVVRAIESAAPGPVEEGSVGAGTGTVALGWKGGIGTSSRRLPAEAGGHTIGVLAQSNFGGDLTIGGAPVGRELGRSGVVAGPGDAGSVMIVVATDAPLDARNLGRLGARALAGLARTGAAMANGSGDYVIAFSTLPRRDPSGRPPGGPAPLGNDAMTPLFRAAAEATEEAIYNSLFRATTVRGHRGTGEALPIPQTVEILRKYRAVPEPVDPP